MTKEQRIQELEERFAALHAENVALTGSGRANISYLRDISEEMVQTYEELQALKAAPSLHIV